MKTIQTENLHSVDRLQDQWPRLAALALTYFLCAWLAYNLFGTVQRIVSYYVPVPVQDYWRVAENLLAYENLHWGVFWKQHNEHRIIFPEVVFALDVLWAHGRMILTLVFSFICYASTFGVLAASVTGDRETAFANRLDAVLLAGVLTFWQGSALALAQPFLLEWPLMQLGVALSIFLLKRTAETSYQSHLAGTIAAAVVATYSSANALLLWPLLLTIALFIRLKVRFLMILTVAAVVSMGLYFAGYHMSGNAHLGAIFQHPGFFIGFAATYLAMPFSAMKSVGFGVSIGLANFALMILLLVRARRSNLLKSRPVIVLTGYYLFTLITIFITAVGRMDLADVEFRAARVNRYLTVPFLNWGAVLLLCLWMSARLQWRWFSPRRLAVLFSIPLMIGAYKLRTWQQYDSDEFASYQLAALSMDAGLTDAELIQRLFPSPEFVEKFLPEFKKQKLAVFGHEHEKWLGGNLAQFGGKELTEKLPGEISYANPVEHGLEVVGWVSSGDVRDPYPRIVLVNEEHKIVGFGRRPTAGFPRDLITLKTPEQESWVAFANSDVPSRTISVYALTRHGAAPIEGVVPVPNFEAGSATDAGAPVTDITWNLNGWTPNGIPVLPPYGWHPPSTPYSSWHGSDTNVGQISGEFATPPGACVVLGMLHGPRTGGLSSQLINSETGTVLVDFPLSDSDPLWALWRVPIPANVKRLKFVGTDNGHDWGQWLAVTTPMACK